MPAEHVASGGFERFSELTRGARMAWGWVLRAEFAGQMRPIQVVEPP